MSRFLWFSVYWSRKFGEIPTTNVSC